MTNSKREKILIGLLKQRNKHEIRAAKNIDKAKHAANKSTQFFKLAMKQMDSVVKQNDTIDAMLRAAQSD